MTREEMMERARVEINQAVAFKQNRLMNLVEQAWDEGKRHAEVEALTDIVKEALTNGQNRTSNAKYGNEVEQREKV